MKHPEDQLVRYTLGRPRVDAGPAGLQLTSFQGEAPAPLVRVHLPERQPMPPGPSPAGPPCGPVNVTQTTGRPIAVTLTPP